MSLRMRWAGVLAGALLAFAVQAKAADNSTNIIVYIDKNAGGAHQTIQTATPSLSGTNFQDKISSVFVVSGSWQLCTKKEYGGTCQTFNQGLTNLDATMNDHVTSLRPINVAQGAAVFFLDKDGGGKSLRATGEIRKMADFPGFASSISSVAVFSGNWEICKKNDYKGACTTLKPGVYNLNEYDNYINSLRPK